MKLNLKTDHQWVGPEDDEGYLWAVQGGAIYGWSESNTQFELAWWLDEKGLPIRSTAQVDAIIAERPFDPEWLGSVNP